MHLIKICLPALALMFSTLAFADSPDQQRHEAEKRYEEMQREHSKNVEEADREHYKDDLAQQSWTRV